MKSERLVRAPEWTSPTLAVLPPGDPKVRAALARDPKFAAKAVHLITAKH